MRVLGFMFLLATVLSPLSTRAEVPPLDVAVPEAKAWMGQRVPFRIELRARGSFAGSASFDLPQVPGTLLIKIGNPVVGTKEIEGESWFVQTHEFALFSQKVGTLEIPSFPVRFERREDFTGPAKAVQAKTPALKFEIERPPGSENLGFLVTTNSIDISESWEPAPGSADVGAIFKRAIVQRAKEIPGMALVPIPDQAPDGIRIYPGEAATNDQLARGEFLGERRETITYLIQKPGTLELPELTYVWWNPVREELQSKTLPGVTFEVAPVAESVEQPQTLRRTWPWLLGVIAISGLLWWQRQTLSSLAQRSWQTLNPPHRVAARRLHRACRNHDTTAAAQAWTAWRNTQGSAYQADPELGAEILILQRQQFGPESRSEWRGDELARIFSARSKIAERLRRSGRSPVLPSLNP